jgi:putative endonuclease
MFHVYILYSKSLQQYYVGSTDDIAKRLLQHNSGIGNFTSKGIPWDLVWSVSFETRQLAVALEMKIKKRGISRYIQDNNLILNNGM